MALVQGTVHIIPKRPQAPPSQDLLSQANNTSFTIIMLHVDGISTGECTVIGESSNEPKAKVAPNGLTEEGTQKEGSHRHPSAPPILHRRLSNRI